MRSKTTNVKGGEGEVGGGEGRGEGEEEGGALDRKRIGF